MSKGKNSFDFSLFRWLGGYSGVWLTLYPFVYLLLARKRALTDSAAVDASAMGFVLYTFIAFFIACKDLSRYKSREWLGLMFHSPLLWFVLYSMLALVSVCWSVDAKMTGYRTFEAFSMMILIVAALLNVTQKGGVNVLFNWTAMYAVLTIFAQFLTHAKSYFNLMYLLQSSQMFAPVLFYAVIFSTCEKWKKYIVVFFSLASGSTVSYIGMTFGSVSFLNHKKAKLFAVVTFSTLAFAAAIVGPSVMLKETLFADKAEISLEHTSGRNHVMNTVMDTLPDNPLGNGFFAGEPFILYQYYSGAINGHNSFFSAALGLGYPGVLLMLFFFGHLGILVMFNKLPKHVKACLFGCFCVAFLNSMGNPGVGSRVYGGWMSTMYIYVMISMLTLKSRKLSL